jgi:NADPH-dependent curcumin reductase CurA
LKSREIILASRPSGVPTAANFAIAEREVAPLGDGQVRVRNAFMSVDPYMRGRMNDTKSYVPPFAVGEALQGGAVGVVEESRDPALPPGTTVLSNLGWRDVATAPAAQFTPVAGNGVPPSAYLGVLGMPGMTAWVGCCVIDTIAAGETVLISSAAGAVGSVAGQIAKRRGARVIGTTRSTENAVAVRERLGFDEAIVLEPGRIREQLRAAAPGGIDFYFENVGGEQLEAALDLLNDFGRISACGMIAGYNTPGGGPGNIMNVVRKRLKMQGFIVSDHAGRRPDFLAEIGPAVARGDISGLETTVHGLDAAPEAFISLFAPGAHLGKLVVAL